MLPGVAAVWCVQDAHILKQQPVYRFGSAGSALGQQALSLGSLLCMWTHWLEAGSRRTGPGNRAVYVCAFNRGRMTLQTHSCSACLLFARVGCCSTFSAVDASLDVDSLPPPDIKGTIRDRACSHVH